MKKAFQPPASSTEFEVQPASVDLLSSDQILRGLRDKLRRSNQLDGLDSVGAAFVFGSLYRSKGGPIVWLCSSNRQTEEIANNLNFFLPDRQQDILVLPGIDVDPYRGLSPHPSVSARRAVALWRLADGFRGIVIAPLSSVVLKTVDPTLFLERCTKVQVGSQIVRERLISRLRAVGYVREDPVSEPGEFSFRGGIVDVFSPSREFPVRIEFFGDDVESIREFDPSTQRSVNFLHASEVVPMREVVVSREDLELWHNKAPEFWKDVRFAESLNEARQFTAEGETFNGHEFLLPLVLEAECSLFDFFANCSEELSVVLPEPQDLFSSHEAYVKRMHSGYEDASLDGALALPPDMLFFSVNWLKRQLSSKNVYQVEKLSEQSDQAESFDFRPTRKYDGRIQELLKDIARWRAKGERIAFVASSEGMADRISELLREYEIQAPHVASGLDEVLNHHLSVTTGKMLKGFHSPRFQIHFITQDEVFGERRRRPSPTHARRKEIVGQFISDFRDLRVGDFVVHVEHGIGVFSGLKKLGVGDQLNEFVLLEYAGGAKLYVPVDRLDLIQKYSSGTDTRPHIDRLGGTSWKKTKARIKKAMRELAEELLKLYARREIAKGHAFGVDDELVHEFEQAFEYEETADQLAAILACKEDMESARPMDRLICGDVGYGKTEVAMRAAFKSVNDGKQVAVLAPTTVLAFQHLNTFTERFQGFPVNIEMLSRFLKRAEQKEVVKRVRTGGCDVLIGTHRLFSKDVSFSDLGLIVVDEEQRFGVAQKERLKKLREQVDVLTLSATPIPRTLNMSLAGIRDLSIIETAPKDRLAIQTVVVKFSHKVIESAIDLELKRNGQAFFLHNSVETIYSVANLIQKIVPDARVGVAHGQMREDLLEEVMLDFLSYRYDVLVCTTIIENGLDIPRANTILINRSDRFGLSQLYQLRGRVGRSDRRAYAYLLIAGDEMMTGDAKKRLAAIREFSDLGSGFRLAALDLEIRGAGNMLGGEQSGHMASVGFDLYVKLLDQAVRELKGETASEQIRTSIDLRVDIQVPEHYIDDSNMRLWLYKRISTASSDTRVQNLQDEIVDRFGKYPRSVSNLFEYARLRIRGEALKITAVERKGSQVILKFREDTQVSPTSVIQMVSSNKDLSFQPDGSLAVEVGEAHSSVFAQIHSVLDELSEAE